MFCILSSPTLFLFLVLYAVDLILYRHACTKKTIMAVHGRHGKGDWCVTSTIKVTTKNKWSTHEHSHPHPATQRARSGFGCTPRACTSTHPASTRPTRRSEVRSECDARAQRVARKDGGGEAVVPFLSVSIK